MVHMLHGLGARVSGLSLAPEPAARNFCDLAGVASRTVDHRIGDILTPGLAEAWMAANQPEILFHLAAQPLVRRSYVEPVRTFDVNVMGLVQILEAVRKTPSLRAVVVITTDKCYENDGQIWGFREGDPLGGSDPYSASKACAEIVSASYRRSFLEKDGRCLLATARAGNVIGGGDWAEDRLIPDIIRALLAGRPIDIRNPAAVRPWQHVMEPLRGYLELGRRLLAGQADCADAWNFGPVAEDQIPVSDIAERMVTLWGAGEIAYGGDPNAPKEAATLRLDISKAAYGLDYRPCLPIGPALDATVEWYRAVSCEGADAATVTQQQIADYFARAYGAAEGGRTQ